MSDPIGPPTFTPAPVVKESVGTWPTGLADHVTEEQFAALKAMAGLTVDPSTLVRERLDNDKL